ncbi:hypothetical protein D3C72_1945480 [compost metagenome]
MSDRMSQVQNRPLAMLAFIIADDYRLDRASTLQGVAKRLCIQGKQRLCMLTAPVGKFTVQNQTVLHHLSQAG